MAAKLSASSRPFKRLARRSHAIYRRRPHCAQPASRDTKHVSISRRKTGEPMRPPTVEAPLTGITVIDLSRILAGPYCPLMLAERGARVIKIDPPERGDDARHYGP